MSFSLLPIASPVPAPAAGAAAPAGSGAAGFEDLLAALFGDAAQSQAQPLPATQAMAGGKILTPEGGEDVVPESETEADAESAEAAILSPEAQTAMPGLTPPTPVAAPDLTAPVASTPVAQAQVGQAAVAEAPAPAQAGLPVDATDQATEGPETAVLPAATASDGDEQPVMSSLTSTQTTANTAAAEGRKAEAAPTTTGDAAPRPAPAAQPAPQAAAAPTPPAAQATAAPPPPATAAQASAQPMLTAAAAAGVVSLKAGQSAPSSATAPQAESDDAPEPAVAKASQFDAKSPFPAQNASPFALTNTPAPILAKADGVAAPTLEPVLSEAPSSEAADLGGLDSPDSAGPLASGAMTTPGSEIRDAARPAATAATVADLAAQVSRRLEGRSTHFDIQLTPQGLGRVDVRVDIDAQGKLTAAMAFDNPHAANEMRGRSGELMRALEQAGFDLSGGLSFNSPQDQRGGGQFADQAPEREAWQGRAFQNAMGVADEAETAVVAARLYQQRQSPTGVDLRI